MRVFFFLMLEILLNFSYFINTALNKNIISVNSAVMVPFMLILLTITILWWKHTWREEALLPPCVCLKINFEIKRNGKIRVAVRENVSMATMYFLSTRADIQWDGRIYHFPANCRVWTHTPLSKDSYLINQFALSHNIAKLFCYIMIDSWLIELKYGLFSRRHSVRRPGYQCQANLSVAVRWSERHALCKEQARLAKYEWYDFPVMWRRRNPGSVRDVPHGARVAFHRSLRSCCCTKMAPHTTQAIILTRV